MAAPTPIYACLIAPTAPPWVVRAARTIGSSLARRGWTLRTGASGPGEAAVEQGHREVSQSRLFVHLPWRRFNAHASPYCIVPDEALALARSLIPNPDRAPVSQIKLIGAMMQAVLGDRLDRPCDFVVAWTPDGAYVGDAGAALTLVLNRGLPNVNLARLPAGAAVGRTLAAAAAALEPPVEVEAVPRFEVRGGDGNAAARADPRARATPGRPAAPAAVPRPERPALPPPSRLLPPR